MLRKLLMATLLVLLLSLVIVLTCGCGRTPGLIDSKPASQEATTTTYSKGTVSRGTAATLPMPNVSELEPIVPPTLPQKIPGYARPDPATGLHVTGTPQVVDFADYQLKVSGKVDKDLGLTYDDLRSLPKVTATPTLVCPGFFEDTAMWSGVPLHIVLEMAGVQPDAESIRMTSADGYSASLDLDSALLRDNFLAYELEGEPLPVLHGFPLRAVIPARSGSVWVKWLVEIEVE